MFDVAEPTSPKPGNGSLKLLEAVFNVIREEGIVPEGGGGCEGIVPGIGGSVSATERFFDAQYQYFYKQNNCMQVTARDNLH